MARRANWRRARAAVIGRWSRPKNRSATTCGRARDGPGFGSIGVSLTLDEAAKALAHRQGIEWLELEEETLRCGGIESQLRNAAPAVLVLEDQSVIALES